MSDTPTVSQLRSVFEEALDLAARKNADYGDAWRENGWRGNLSRVFEKAKRLRNLLWRPDAQPTLVGEQADETALDLLNTLAFFLINRRGGVEWGHEEPYGYGIPWGGDSAKPIDPQAKVQGGEYPGATGHVPADVVAAAVGTRVPGDETKQRPTPKPRAIKPN